MTVSIVTDTENHVGIPVMSCSLPDYSKFCDVDIMALFTTRVYMSGDPLMAQLIKEMRLLREALKERSNE